MSNIFRDSESLGKSNGKKWSQIGKFLLGSGLKSPKKIVFLADFALQNKVEPTLPDGLGTTPFLKKKRPHKKLRPVIIYLALYKKKTVFGLDFGLWEEPKPEKA